jgi:hypothetical protein
VVEGNDVLLGDLLDEGRSYVLLLEGEVSILDVVPEELSFIGETLDVISED